jgi:hypothetical protein
MPFGISKPNFCAFLVCTAVRSTPIILSHRFRVCGTHHAKAGSNSNLFLIAYSATSIGFADLRLHSGSQLQLDGD